MQGLIKRAEVDRNSIRDFVYFAFCPPASCVVEAIQNLHGKTMLALPSFENKNRLGHPA